MADSKISQLTGATTPLAGTEVVPIVQSGATKKVSIDNLTAGRVVPVVAIDLTATGSGLPSNGGMVRLANGYSYVAPASTDYGLVLSNSDGTGRFRMLGASGTSNIEVETGTGVLAGTFTADGNYAPASGKGVNFTANTPAAGMTSQLLNWYEEGTWTPTIIAGSLTINNTACYYTRIGNQVTLFFDVTFPVQVNANDADFFSLPFTISANGGSAAAIATDRSATDPTYAQGFVNQTRLRFSDGLLAILTLTQMSGKRVKGSYTYRV